MSTSPPRLIRVTILAVFLAGAGSVDAQTFRFTRLGSEDGLSQATVYAIAQDLEGFLWVGTQNGINRYDGRSFRTGWRGDEDPTPANYGRIRALHVDSEGRLWVGIDDHGLYLFDRRSESFSRLRVDSSAFEEVRHPVRFHDVAEWNDTLLVATDAGLAVIDLTGEHPTLRPRGSTQSPTCAAETSALAVTEDALWIGTSDGCLLSERTDQEPSTVRLTSGQSVRSIAVAPESGLLVATYGAGVFRVASDGRLLSEPRADGVATATDQASVVTVNTGGDTWIGTRGGLGWISAETRDTTWISAGPATGGQLPHQTIESLFEDAGGVLWVGTWNGVARVSPFYRGLRFVPRPEFPGAQRSGGIVPMVEDDMGDLIVGSLGGLLARVSTSGAHSGIAIDDAPPLAVDVLSMARDGEGRLWVATNGEGILRRDRQGWRSYRAGTDGPLSTPDDQVAAVHVDRSGAVWAGTIFSGLAIYDREQDRFRRFDIPGSELVEPYVWPIREDANGGLWFGANGFSGGIYHVDPQRQSARFFDTSGAEDEHPNAGRILTLSLSGDTLVWFGTQGAGLGRLDPRTGSLRFYTVADGLPHGFVEGILDDGSGNVWISTNAGLARFDPTAETFWIFREGSGVQGDRFFANATHRSSDGRLHFGGENGITIVDPARVAARAEAPRVALTGFAIRGQAQGHLNHVVASEGIHLGPEENFFTIEFSAMDFIEPGLNRYLYRLDPFDDEWVDPGVAGTARYTGVPHGRYLFRVRAMNSQGVWNEEALAIPIDIAPPFHQTVWFRGTLLLLVAALTGAAFAYRAAQLERVRAMRLQIASDLHDDIGANLNAIALKSDLLRRHGHQPGLGRGQRSLNDIQRLANDTMQKVREMIWVVKSENDTVESLVVRMQDVATTMLRGMMEVRFSVTPDLPNRQVPMRVRQDAYLGFKEALQNAIRHSGASCVDIVIDHQPPDLCITVADDGDGFDPEAVDKGNGLTLLEKRARSGGATRYRVRSVPGAGTKVEIIVRLV